MPQPNTPLGFYIDDLRQRQNLSWRKASYLCGLSPETLSMLVRRDKTATPRPSTLRAIADGMGANYGHMMILAGHLEVPDETEPPPDLQALIAKLLEIYNDIRHDPEAVKAYTTSIGVHAEAIRLVHGADEKAAASRIERDTTEPATARLHIQHG